MDPELTKQLQQLLAALLANAQDAATWAKAELPLLVKEKIAFGRAWDSALLVVLLLVSIFVVKAWNRWSAYEANDVFNKGALAIPMGIATVLWLGMCVAQLHDVLLVWFAPRLYIVEWLIGMLKSGTPSS